MANSRLWRQLGDLQWSSFIRLSFNFALSLESRTLYHSFFHLFNYLVDSYFVSTEFRPCLHIRLHHIWFTVPLTFNFEHVYTLVIVVHACISSLRLHCLFGGLPQVSSLSVWMRLRLAFWRGTRQLAIFRHRSVRVVPPTKRKHYRPSYCYK